MRANPHHRRRNRRRRKFMKQCGVQPRCGYLCDNTKAFVNYRARLSLDCQNPALPPFLEMAFACTTTTLPLSFNGLLTFESNSWVRKTPDGYVKIKHRNFRPGNTALATPKANWELWTRRAQENWRRERTDIHYGPRVKSTAEASIQVVPQWRVQMRLLCLGKRWPQVLFRRLSMFISSSCSRHFAEEFGHNSVSNIDCRYIAPAPENWASHCASDLQRLVATEMGGEGKASRQLAKRLWQSLKTQLIHYQKPSGVVGLQNSSQISNGPFKHYGSWALVLDYASCDFFYKSPELRQVNLPEIQLDFMSKNSANSDALRARIREMRRHRCGH